MGEEIHHTPLQLGNLASARLASCRELPYWQPHRFTHVHGRALRFTDLAAAFYLRPIVCLTGVRHYDNARGAYDQNSSEHRGSYWNPYVPVPSEGSS
jgi:hypothetical protein